MAASFGHGKSEDMLFTMEKEVGDSVDEVEEEDKRAE